MQQHQRRPEDAERHVGVKPDPDRPHAAKRPAVLTHRVEEKQQHGREAEDAERVADPATGDHVALSAHRPRAREHDHRGHGEHRNQEHGRRRRVQASVRGSFRD